MDQISYPASALNTSWPNMCARLGVDSQRFFYAIDLAMGMPSPAVNPATGEQASLRELCAVNGECALSF